MSYALHYSVQFGVKKMAKNNFLGDKSYRMQEE
jgi:hypothetical protein